MKSQFSVRQRRYLPKLTLSVLLVVVLSQFAFPRVARANLLDDLLVIIADAANSFFNVTGLVVDALEDIVVPDDTHVVKVVATKAACGFGSNPETGLQGQVPEIDRSSGRSKQGYNCNLELVGQYQGQGAIAVNSSSGSCVYNATSALNPNFMQWGVQVIEASDSTRPRLSTRLTSPAMLSGTGESLRVNEKRKLLAGVSVAVIPSIEGGLFFDLYDISDCAYPKLLNGVANATTPLNLTQPVLVLGHEGIFSPDGNTYWSAGNAGGPLAAIDVSDTAHPKVVWNGLSGLPATHGMSLSADGNRLFLASTFIGGVEIFDVSEIQARKQIPKIYLKGSVFWRDKLLGADSPVSGTITQHTIPVTYGGKPYLIAPDEAGAMGIHVIDISDETDPKEVVRFNLEIMKKENESVAQNDMFGVRYDAWDKLHLFPKHYVHDFWTYNAHYCTVDRAEDPTALACGFMQSGIRVFDIRDFKSPREIAYFNPPAQTNDSLSVKASTLQGSYHANLAMIGLPGLPDASSRLSLTDLSADWCMSPPRFVGSDQLWVSCMDNGLMVLKFTNNVYPIKTN